MIVRREKRRRNYTICPNEIFEVGLKPEDVGFLTHLLSRPDDWKVLLKELAKHWDIGRDKTERIIKNLIAAGYIKRKRIRDLSAPLHKRETGGVQMFRPQPVRQCHFRFWHSTEVPSPPGDFRYGALNRHPLAEVRFSAI